MERYRNTILFGGIGLLFSALLVGTEVNGAKLWLRIGGLSFQPIEIVKICLVITLASFWRRFRLWMRFSKGRLGGRLPKRGMLFLALGWFLGLVILVVQRDLGMALLLIGVFFTLFYAATGRKKYVFLGVGAFFVASVGAILFFHHIRIRIRAWWDPFLFYDTDGYQLVQGLYAIADGGPWGRGLFLGRPHVIPEAHTDFILPAVSHELGWLTALCVVYCAAYLGRSFFELAHDCRGEFRSLLLTGLASLWSLQCFIILAGTTKVIPMTGLTLPFLSYGGSSLLANALLLSLIARCADKGAPTKPEAEVKPPQSKRRIKKLGLYHNYLFLLPGLSLLFYGWLTAVTLNERPDNPQRTAPLNRRGAILDRQGKALAENQDGKRVYPFGESTGALVGYHLRGRNQSGLEAALRIPLSPPLPPASLRQAIEQDRDTKRVDKLFGPNLSLTLDADLQSALYQRMQNKAGALVVSDRNGAILAAVSSPSFDSNTVRQDWQKLREDKRSPFIERVGSGYYPALLPDGSTLVAEPDRKSHPWFSQEPFPAYPLSSPALLLENHVLVTPLMLCDLALAQSAEDERQNLHLMKAPESSGRSAPRSNSDLGASLKVGQLDVWTLLGPAFQTSPEFLVRVGKREDELFFAIVLEELSPTSQALIEQELLPVLNSYQPKPK